jgi:hypothetical protein
MRARFIGDDSAPWTLQHRIIKDEEYNIGLEHAGLIQRFFTRARIILLVQVRGMWHSVPYGSMKAFEANWRVK